MSWEAPWNSSINRKYGKSKPAMVVNTNWRSVPWEELHNQVLAAQEMELRVVESQRQQQYAKYILAKEAEYTSLHESPYEGNLSDEYPIGETPKAVRLRVKQKASSEAVAAFCEERGLKSLGISIIPQIIKHISSFKLSTVSGEPYDPKSFDPQDPISGRRLYSAYFKEPVMAGVYDFLMADTRSSWLTTQYKSPAKSYCALVPLIMSAFKTFHKVPYAHWNRDDINGIVHPKLADAMLFSTDVVYSKECILKSRDEGLMNKSGIKLGQLRDAKSSYKLYGKTDLSGLPEYIQVMYAQIWCAHPDNRSTLMVLDPSNWDRVPLPLVSTEVLEDFEFGHFNTDKDSPW